MIKSFCDILKCKKEEILQDLMEMGKFPATNLKVGKKGQYARMQWICNYLDRYKLSYTILDAPDVSLPGGSRMNLCISFPGKKQTKKTLWLIAHVDTVNIGDREMWRTDPLVPICIGERVYGLGMEDACQTVIAMLYICRILKEEKFEFSCNVNILFVSVEESGNYLGMKYLADQNLFSPEDAAIVADGGSPDGSFIQIAEKSQVWLKFIINGKQSHAFTPDQGINACSIGMHLGSELEDYLCNHFNEEDELFYPKQSTFVLTQKFSNVGSPNTLPGKDIFFMDMRILPCYEIDEVIALVDQITERYEGLYPGCLIETEFVTCISASPPTDIQSPIIQCLAASIQEEGITPRFGGVGENTCAVVLRERGIPVAVWSTKNNTAHQPNEYAEIDHVLNDMEVLLSTVCRYAEL